MARRLWLFVRSMMVCLVSLFITVPVLAIPNLPSSFYGEVRVNDVYVPDGIVVRALIDGQVYAEGYTQTYKGASVYTLDVPGNDAATTTQDGGSDGDKVQFEIGGVLADQTGTWHSATSVRLDLTASSARPLATSQSTPSPVPTQTPIVLVQSLSTKTTSVHPVPTITTSVESSLTATEIVQISPSMTTISQSLQKPAVLGQPTPNSIEIVYFSPEPALHLNLNPEEDGSVNPTLTIALIAVAIVTGIVLWVIFKRMYNVRNSNSSKQHKTNGGSS